MADEGRSRSTHDGHWWNSLGTLQCPVERVATDADDDGECSACGADVTDDASDQS